MIRILKYIGLRGVSPNENEGAKGVGRYFNVLLMGALAWLLFQWHLEWTNQLTFKEAWHGNFVIWLFFFTESSLLLYLVDNKKKYVKENYLNFVIILVGLPLLLLDYGPMISALRLLRFIFVIGLVIPWLAIALRFLTDNRLDTTIFTAIVILFTAGIIIVDIEPGINNISDGIWWAWVTISTVGYGDIVPVTKTGRLFGAFLILIGMGLFSIITANFAAIFMQRRENKKARTRWEKTLSEISDVKKEEDEIISKLNEIITRIEKLEKNQQKKS